MKQSFERPPLSAMWQHKVFLLVFGAIVVSSLMVVISLYIYSHSTAIELDLSRPGYKNVRSKVVNSETFHGLEATGPLDDAVKADFLRMYDEQSKGLGEIDSFSSNALSDKSLGLPEATDQ